MKRFSTTATALPPSVLGPVGKAWDEVSASFERFCLAAGIEALGAMMEKDAEEACGPRHARGEGRCGHRWGRTRGKRLAVSAWLGSFNWAGRGDLQVEAMWRKGTSSTTTTSTPRSPHASPGRRASLCCGWWLFRCWR